MTDEERKAAIKHDAEALALLILDIYKEKKRKEASEDVISND